MKLSCFLFTILMLACPAAMGDSFESGFHNPPKEAHPLVWWHWMNGNISKEGIKKDLEWLHGAGITGFHIFDANMATPQVVKYRLAYMTPAWKEAFNYALDLADSLDMEVSIASSPGWSITGGPWVCEEDAEKKLVWSETSVTGGQALEIALDMPPQCCGPYQSIPLYPDDPLRFTHYEDLHVLAVRIPDSIPELASAAISTSQKDLCTDFLTDKDYGKHFTIGPGQDGYSWIEFNYPSPGTLQSVFLVGFGLTPVCLEMMSDEDGEYVPVLDDIPVSRIRTTAVRTFSFPPSRGTRFRIRAKIAGEVLDISEVGFSAEPKIDLVEDKAGFLPVYTVYDNYPTPEFNDVPSLKDVYDISKYFKDGVLRWKAPEGRWIVYRFGWNLLGNRNAPASPEATGLEVDKLDGDAVRRYYNNYLGMYENATGGRLGSSLKGLMIDSYESGKCTWTSAMEKEFRLRRGYDLKPWLPVLTGRILGSSRQSEQFLFDWRITLGELMAENHYDIVDPILAEYGMFRYSESHEWRKAFVGDGMMPKRNARIPMAAMWIHNTDEGWHSTYPAGEADIRESSSVSHIYGQNICAAESFTVDGRIGERNGMGAYQSMPCNLKALADGMMAEGVNRFVIHSSVHQPVDDKLPGLGLGPFGQWFNRNDTWASEAGEWINYLTRSSFLLQKGKWVADIAYFYGEDKNVTGIYIDRRIPVPDGFNFDLVNADILLNEMHLAGQELVSRTGMKYKVLMIDEDVKYISMPVLKRIYQLARAGVLICGHRPSGKAGLSGSERRFSRIVSKIWDRGRKNILESPELPFEKDVCIETGKQGDMRFVHRKDDNTDIYWIANIEPEAKDIRVSFRITGKEPEIWHADSGVIEPASYSIKDGRTYVDLSFTADDAQFIVFRKTAPSPSRSVKQPVFEKLTDIQGPWTVCFQRDRGAPARAVFNNLQSYTDSSIEGIRYFSGTAVYSNSFSLSDIPDSSILSLGTIHSMARVCLNGVDLGSLWKSPYIVDCSKALRKGKNQLTITVINSWANRLIGDERRQPCDRITYTSERFYTEHDAPIPAGLIGPVSLFTKTE